MEEETSIQNFNKLKDKGGPKLMTDNPAKLNWKPRLLNTPRMMDQTEDSCEESANETRWDCDRRENTTKTNTKKKLILVENIQVQLCRL